VDGGHCIVAFCDHSEAKILVYARRGASFFVSRRRSLLRPP
jgi:hypothetical protein